jgi:hypothetical protein
MFSIAGTTKGIACEPSPSEIASGMTHAASDFPASNRCIRASLKTLIGSKIECRKNTG